CWNRELPRHTAEPKLLRDGCQQNRCFHRCECGSDALPKSSPKRKINEAWELLRGVGEPAVGVEFLRITEISRMTMHDPLAHDHVRAGRNLITPKFEIGDDRPRQTPGGRVEPHGLPDDALGVRQLLHVRESRSAPGEHAVELFMQATLHIRMLA